MNLEYKEECLDFIDDKKEICNDLNMRTLLKVLKIRKSVEQSSSEEGLHDWRELSTFIMTQQ
jgi:hypothetical protein